MTPVAICIGHSRPVNGKPEGGAVMIGGMNEWTYNQTLGKEICEFLRHYRIPTVLIDHYTGASYGAAQRHLAAHLRELGAMAAVELHFNSSDDPAACGHEWLYWHSSTASKHLASELESEMSLAVPGIRTRGIKPRTLANRGAAFLSDTHCPAVICEPFFGSNAHDCATATLKRSVIARAIAEGISSWMD